MGIYIYIYIHSCRAACTDFSDPLLFPVSIVHRFWGVFQATPCIGRELLQINSCWSSCLGLSLSGVLQLYIVCVFALTFPAVSRVSGSSNLDGFRDGL